MLLTSDQPGVAGRDVIRSDLMPLQPCHGRNEIFWGFAAPQLALQG